MRLIPAVIIFSSVSLAGAPVPRPQASARANAARPIVAQRLVDDFVRTHAELAALELAVIVNGVCRTVAATAPEDIGEKCDADELGPIRTGKPDVEAPTKDDPVYDITQALHDSAGHLIGAVGMDIKPAAGPTRAAVIARAREWLRALEAMIPSKARLLEPAAE